MSISVSKKQLTIDDFVSLVHVAKKLAEKLDDEPDLYGTLERCNDADVVPAYWKRDGVDVWQYRPEAEGKESFPLMGCGDYITNWGGAFFLTGGCIKALYNSGGDNVFWSEFFPNETAYEIRDYLTVVSSRDMGVATYEAAVDDTMEENSVTSADDLPHHEKVLLDALKESFEDLPNDNGYLEFGIKDIKVLRSDLAKLGLGKDGVKTLAEIWKSPTRENIRCFLDAKIKCNPVVNKPSSQKKYCHEAFNLLGFSPEEIIPDIYIQAVDSFAVKAGIKKDTFRRHRATAGYKGLNKQKR